MLRQARAYARWLFLRTNFFELRYGGFAQNYKKILQLSDTLAPSQTYAADVTWQEDAT